MQSNERNLPMIDVELGRLPSKGISYPSGSKISFRQYTFGEIQHCSTSIREGYTEYLKFAMLGIKCNFDPMSIIFSDAIYICMLRKISSLNSLQVELPYVCANGKCRHENKATFTQNDIKFKDIEAEELPAYLTLSNGKEYEFMPMTVGKFFDISDGKIEINGKKSQELMKDKIALLSMMVKNHPLLDTYKDFNSLTNYEDGEDIEEIDKMLFCDMLPLSHNCEKCNQLHSIILEGKEHLLRPFRQGERSDRRRIRFGSKHQPVATGHEVSGIQRSDIPEQESGRTFKSKRKG